MRYDIIDQQSYEMGYAAGFADGHEESFERGYQECIRDEKRRKKEELQDKACKLYYIIQKSAGVVMLAITVLTIMLLDGDATIALFLLPLILMLIFSKKPLIVSFQPNMEMAENEE